MVGKRSRPIIPKLTPLYVKYEEYIRPIEKQQDEHVKAFKAMKGGGK